MAMKCLNCDCERLRYSTPKDAYVCLNCGYEFAKQYFFISHSHLDIEKVRIIRNVIEETFFYEPILFFLKCLSDENELQDLIRREIGERIWFVYCKSENAERSKYVQQEREYLQKLLDSGKRINVLEIELDKFEIWDKDCHDYIRKQIAYHIRTSKIFISYSHADAHVAREMRAELTERGFSVWMDTDMAAGASYAETIVSKIKENSYKDGVFLFLMTPQSSNNMLMQHEMRCAIDCGAMIVPVYLTDETSEAIDGNAQFYLPNVKSYTAARKDVKSVCDKIIDGLRKR